MPSFQNTTSAIGEVAKASPPFIITAIDRFGVYIDPVFKLITAVYTVMQIVNLLKQWRKKRHK